MSDANERSKRRVGGATKTAAAALAFSDELQEEVPIELDCFAACGEDSAIPRSQSSRRSSVANRRRSSMGGVRRASLSEAEQTRIVEMYKTVIQMSSENKLNEKNSWNYDLIDHMGKLITDETKGVNFQKASCTLDASVKIYANRVDDTYATSYRILESLSRNGNGNDEDGDDGSGEGREKPKAKVGSKASSSRLNATDTIERNPEALNATKLEHDYAFDPMFQKLSKSFDEGGAKGMLLYNMRVSRFGCSLSFQGSALEALQKAEHAISKEISSSAAIDMRELLQRSGLTTDRIQPLVICSKLAAFRQQLAISEVAVQPIQHTFAHHAIVDTLASASSLSGTFSRLAISEEGSRGESDSQTAADHDDSPMEYYADDDYSPVEHSAVDSAPTIFSDNEPVIAGRISTAGDGVASTKLRWSISADDKQRTADSMQSLARSLESLKISTTNDYAYFDLDELQSSGNAWAGARHWKYVTRSQAKNATAARSADESAADGASVSTAAAAASEKEPSAKSRKGKKEAVKCVFTLDLVDEAKFGTVAETQGKKKTKTDSTVMTKAMQLKAKQEAPSLLLPIDEKYKVKDLCRLFLWPNVVLLPKHVNPLSIIGGASRSKQEVNRLQSLMDSLAGEDQVWRSDLSSVAAAVEGGEDDLSSDRTASAAVYGASEADDGSYPMFDAGDAVDYEDSDPNSENVAPYRASSLTSSTQAERLPDGLNINQSKLMQVDRVVEKIQIKYEQVSKRVNVHRLKADIFGNLKENLLPAGGDDAHQQRGSKEEKCQDAEDEQGKRTSSGASEKELSFQQLVKTMSSSGSQQKGVTLPYYFICLLHLANEHTLKITDQDDLGDLRIQFDA